MNKHILKLNFLFLAIVFFLYSCSTYNFDVDRSVKNEIDQSSLSTVAKPILYQDPLLEIDKIKKELEKFKSVLNTPISIDNKEQERYFSNLEALDMYQVEYENITDELNSTGELELVSGKSYHFTLDSFCVQGREPRPVVGDGLKLSLMKGNAEKFLPEMLSEYSKKSFSQDEMQTLIWALISGLKYDELSNQNQVLLKKFYPDAELRFGNIAIENFLSNSVSNLMPSQIKDGVDKISDVKNIFEKYQENYSKLEEIMAPIAKRSPIPLGWMKMIDGYFIKVNSFSGFSKVDVEIYVPFDEQDASERVPQSKKRKIFRPSVYVAMPGSGQRLALSGKVSNTMKSVVGTTCSKIKKWISPEKCKEFTQSQRAEILFKADPKNFPKARYVLPPSLGKKIEEEVDCSHFVNEIYHRVGVNYPYIPTVNIECLSYFKEISSEEVRGGDLVLYKGHVGIVDNEGNVISATRAKGLATLPSDNEQFVPSIQKYPINTFGKGRFFKWSCP